MEAEGLGLLAEVSWSKKPLTEIGAEI